MVARFYRSTLQMWGPYPRKLYPWIMFNPSAKGSGVHHEAITRNRFVIYGDKDVKHWKLDATLAPEVPNPPAGFETTEDSRKYNYQYYGYYYECGLNETWSCVYSAHDDWYKKYYISVRHFTVDEDGYLCYSEGISEAVNDGICQSIIAGNYRAVPVEMSTPYRIIDKDYHTVGSLPYGFWTVGDYEVVVPDLFPWYWIDHMDEVHASLPQNPGALSEVIRNTIKDATSLNMNNYANISEVVGYINDFRKGKIFDLINNTKGLVEGVMEDTAGLFSKFSKGQRKQYLRSLGKRVGSTLGDGWLKYRYMYNTTKGDIEEYVSKVSRESFGSSLNAQQVLRGSIGTPCGTMRVKMRLHPNPFAGFDRMLINADRVGLMPGLYNLWDMIPFSFVGDWFAPVGDFLEDIDESVYFRYYKVDELLVSVKETVTIDQPWGPTTYQWYQRYFLEEMPQWEIYEDDKAASGKTITYRCLDALSLAIG